MRLAVSFAAVTLIGTLACGSNKPDPSTDADQALKDARLESVKVKWDGDARVAHLRGTVDSVSDRARAEDVATTVVGTAGKVLNEVTVRGLNEHIADDLDGQIRSDLKKMLDQDKVLRERDIDFDVTNGVVTVKGHVPSVAEKTKVSELVRSAPGVKDLANALEIKPEK
jgi:osmotically-inducible protein OsmY